MKKVICYTDGGARGNPGPAGIGVYVVNEKGEELYSYKKAIGNGTNNFAEYQAVAAALTLLKEKYGKKLKTMDIEIRMDSELVEKQLNNKYQVKDPGLMPQYMHVHNMHVAHFPHLTFTHVRREKNKEADRLANEAMDGVS